jgi:hypothetical protein
MRTLEDCYASLALQMFEMGAALPCAVNVSVAEDSRTCCVDVFVNPHDDECVSASFELASGCFDQKAIAEFIGESLCGASTVH